MFQFGHKKRLDELERSIRYILEHNTRFEDNLFKFDKKLDNLANRLDYKEKFGYLFVGNKRIKLNKDDIKTWANMNDVQVGDRGYGAFWYYQYKQNMSDLITIKEIDEDEYGCFVSTENASYPFFIPLEIVERA